MQTVIFHETVYGPIHSRRLGVSLGINLMPNDGKICSFDCVYCEAGYNEQGKGNSGVPSREAVKRALKRKLEEMQAQGSTLDVITFSGNGEPTLHPQFKEIVHDTKLLRDRFYPQAKVSVLSNSTMAARPGVMAALKEVDNCILKLDSAFPATMRLINQPVSPNVLPVGIVADLKAYAGICIVQTMFLRGEHNGKPIDNTTAAEVDALIAAYRAIQPREVMIYTIDRTTPEEHLVKVPVEELKAIGARIEQETGIKVQVNG